MLRKRIITSLWGIPLLSLAVWFDSPLPWFTILITGWGVLAVLEFYRAVAQSRVPPLTYFGLVLTALFILSRESLPSVIQPYLDIRLLLTSLVVLPLIFLLLRKQKEGAIAGWVWTVAGILYIGWLLGYLVELRGLEGGRNWVFLTFLATFASDTAAFFTGRAVGKHKLAPDISPAKTREGAAAGAVGGVLASLFFILPTPLQLPINLWQATSLGLLVSVFGQLGDLTESLFKRNMGVKDSGNLLPGHGGLLDRLDSIIFAGVAVYYFIKLFKLA
ncbi:MAG TPA: phosphatidate cytidylyltransferase [Dehalococcoidales bacterium]|nr:phosphatidate cytidylyltransferase [Dehalococcoidales bacterium]